MTDSPLPSTYSDALSELDGILRALDADQVDIDALGDTVARAALLIDTCRARLDVARAGVEDIVAGLAAPPTDSPADRPAESGSETPDSRDSADE